MIDLLNKYINRILAAIRHRKDHATVAVKNTRDDVKVGAINSAIDQYGFMYDIRRDLFTSKIDSWQRELGYCSLYDQNAPLMNMVIESEPVHFDYNGKRWLIELWKGQYGMSCGAEIGVYSTDKPDVEIAGLYYGPFFESVSDSELLNFSMKIEKARHTLFETSARHWWLTGFKLGEFANPSDLKVTYTIEFPDYEMRDAFLRALLYMGYERNELRYSLNTVTVVFDRPKSVQPHRHNQLMTFLIQLSNEYYCKKYMWLTRRFEVTSDKLYYASLCLPRLYKLLLKISKKLDITGKRKSAIKSMITRM